MKIGVIGATGHAGHFILKEAVKSGNEVTAIVRNQNKLDLKVPFVKKDLFDLSKEDVIGYDVLLYAFNAPENDEEKHVSAMEKMVEILTGTNVHFLVVGGTSSLFVDESRTKRAIDFVDSSAWFFPTASNMSKALLILQKSTLNWTYISPASFFDPDGPKTNQAKIFGDVLTTDRDGNGYVSMADYAEKMVEIAGNSDYFHKHVSIRQD
jgi:putative NADH-flavin reductase